MVKADDLVRYAADPLEFFADTIIPAGGSDVRLGDVWAPFQVDAFKVLADCIKAAAVGGKPPYRGIWCERTKGASKDSDVGLALLWLLMFARRPQTIELGADDQAQILETSKAMAAVVRCNPWMAERVEILKSKITCEATASECLFLTRDATGTHGSRPTVTVCNELSHCSDSAFIETMMDNADKIPNNLAILATNAGFQGTFADKWRANYRTDANWWFQKVDVPAPWIDPAKLADAKRRNSALRYLRLWAGQWVRGGGDAIDPADVAACCTLAGPMNGWERGWAFIGALDIGVKHDHSSLVIVGVRPPATAGTLAFVKTWAPGENGYVDLQRVEEETFEAAARFRLLHLRFDPWQAYLTSQRLGKRGVLLMEIPFVPSNLDAMAKAMMTAFRNRKLMLYHEPELLRDLEKLSIVERGWGYKLEAPRDEDGHCDRAIALAMVLPAILNVLDLPAPPQPEPAPVGPPPAREPQGHVVYQRGRPY